MLAYKDAGRAAAEFETPEDVGLLPSARCDVGRFVEKYLRFKGERSCTF